MTTVSTDHGFSHANRRLTDLSVLGLYLILFPACYASVLIVDYGFADDYFDIVAGPDSWPITKKVLEGRPLYALITNISLRFTTDIDDLGHIRFAGIVGIALAAWSVFLALERAGWNGFQSICAGVIIGTTLPFQLYAAWATAGFFPFAALLSGLGFLVGERALDSRSPRVRYLIAAASSLILLAALSIYQPAAMFYWVFVAIAVLRPNTSTIHTVHRFGWHCMICATGLLLAFIIYEAGTSLHPNLPPARTALDFQQIPAKTVWFGTHVLARGLRFAWLHPDYYFNLFTSLIVLVLMAGGGILYLRDTHGKPSAKSAIAVSLIPLSYMPNLAASESLATYRSLSSLTSLLVIYMVFALRGWIGLSRHLRSSHVFTNAVMGSIAISCVIAAAYHVRVFIAVPQFQELEFMRSHFNRESLSRARSIQVIRPVDTPAPFWLDEFGTPSSDMEWNPPSMVSLLLREMYPEYAHIPIRFVDTNDVTAFPPDSLVVDMRGFGKAMKWFLPGGEPVLSGAPIIRSRFDVYLTRNTLTYFRNGCARNDTDERFFLHLIPVDADDLPDSRKQHGSDNLDFEFDDHGIVHSGSCMAKIRLPSYPILSIRTGQFIIDRGRIWDEEFHVLERQLPSG